MRIQKAVITVPVESKRTNPRQKEKDSMMTKKILTAVAIAVGVLTAAPAAQANNMRIGPVVADNTFEVIQVKNKGGHRHGRHNQHNRHNRHFGHGYFEYHAQGCGYFYRKARRTGSHYWWSKYERCVDRQEYFYRY